jgi:hypothetical protein
MVQVQINEVQALATKNALLDINTQLVTAAHAATVAGLSLPLPEVRLDTLPWHCLVLSTLRLVPVQSAG